MQKPAEIERTSGDTELAWRVLGLLNLYRLAVPSVLIALALLAHRPQLLGAASPALYLYALFAWFATGVVCIGLLKSRWPSLQAQAFIHVAFDVIAVSALLLTSGGAASGAGLLLIMPVAGVSLLLPPRIATTVAAIAALCVLGQQIMLLFRGATDSSDLTQAGLLGGVILIAALAGAPLAGRLRESEALVRQRDLDLANLAELSQYIVERLRESLVVVDEQDHIRLINESARQILGGDATASALLGEVSPRLLYLLTMWRQSGPDADTTGGNLLAVDGLREVRPHFAPLGTGQPPPVLIFLEDLTALDDRIHQSRLAALGRLSASIAHEIRNPVGAISHAAQLLGEDAGLSDPNRRMSDIIRANAERVSTIIGNVQQLARRESTRPERMPIGEWLSDFVGEFISTGGHEAGQLTSEIPDPDLEVRVDPSHLRQILWNLCENAFRYSVKAPDDSVEVRIGRLAGSNRPFLEVLDRGPGIDSTISDRIFEPFFTSRASGTGLGLFIARELAQCNRALLVFEPRTGGGSIFRIVFSDPQRWEQT
ncbi:MAG TPA: ATP-binding protein [Steroidobacteraceae bacterium]|nr:ATP-binding protein [Steroidobacteraceae bacterium]